MIILTDGGYTAHVMTFEVGAVLEEPNWQAPIYCLNQTEIIIIESTNVRGDFGSLMRGKVDAATA